MNDNQLYKLIESILHESLKTQKDKYGNNKIDSIKELDPTPTYKYIDAIQKFIYNDNTDKTDIKQYINIYNDKLNKNLIDKDNRDINKFKTFNDFKKYVDSIEDVKSNTSIKKQNRSIINKQYVQNIHTDHGKYKGTYDVYIPYTMEQSIELQSYNTKWCTQYPNKKENWFNNYKFIKNITIYYFVNKDGYTTMITNHEETKEYEQTVMFQVSIDKDNKVIDIRDNADKQLNESELYKLSGIRQNEYEWKPIPDGHYDVNNRKERLICNYKNGKYDGEYIKYYKNGNINIKQNYKNGEYDGEYISYYENGNIKLKQYYKNGKYDGEYVEYYEDGNIHIKQNYKDNKYDGEYIKYYENGNIHKKQNYKNGEYDGEYISYYGNGNILVKTYYANNKIVDGKFIEYYENGNIYEKQHYKNGKYDGEYIRYNLNGDIKFKQYYKNNKLNGEQIIYYENGNIYEKQNYKDDEYNGEYIKYDKDGNIINKSYYKDGIEIEGE